MYQSRYAYTYEGKTIVRKISLPLLSALSIACLAGCMEDAGPAQQQPVSQTTQYDTPVPSVSPSGEDVQSSIPVPVTSSMESPTTQFDGSAVVSMPPRECTYGPVDLPRPVSSGSNIDPGYQNPSTYGNVDPGYGYPVTTC